MRTSSTRTSATLVLEHLQGFLAVSGLGHLVSVTLQDLACGGPDAVVVVDHQDFRHGRRGRGRHEETASAGGRAGSRTVTTAPPSGRIGNGNRPAVAFGQATHDGQTRGRSLPPWW